MKKTLLSIVACLGATTVVLNTGTVANPDTTKVIPYPEVLNLKRVPIFNEKGMVAQSIDVKVGSPKIATKVKAVPERIVKNDILPVKMAVNKPPQQSGQKIQDLLLEHQSLGKIKVDSITRNLGY